MRAAWIPVLCSVLSCASGSGREPEPEGPPWLEVGTGSTAFEPLADGDAVELVMGPQGGWHIDVAARFGGMSPAGLTLAYFALHAGTGADLGFPIKSALNEDRVFDDGGSYVRTGDRIVLDIDGPAEVVGHDIEIHVAARGPSVERDAAVRVHIVDERP